MVVTETREVVQAVSLTYLFFYDEALLCPAAWRHPIPGPLMRKVEITVGVPRVLVARRQSLARAKSRVENAEAYFTRTKAEGS